MRRVRVRLSTLSGPLKILGMLLLPILMAIRAAEGDADIVVRLQRREPQALAELYDRYGRIVYSLILCVVRDTGIAEDLVQETFLRIWNRVQAFDAQRGGVRRIRPSISLYRHGARHSGL